MNGEILWVLTNDTEFTAGWGKNPQDRTDHLLFPDSAYAQLVIRNRGLAAVVEPFGVRETIMVAWGCYRSLEAAAGGPGPRPEAWGAVLADGLALLAGLLARGHRLCPHPHHEKDLGTANPDYRYDPQTGALERWRRWESGYYRYGGSFARALPDLGTYENRETRLGYLSDGREWLAEKLGAWGIAARTGGWDFGYTSEDKLLSEQAFRGNGLLLNLDADLNLSMWRGEPSPSKPWSEGIYLTRLGDINAPAPDGREWGLVELAHCSALPRDGSWYDLNNRSLEDLNRQMDLAFAAFCDEGVVRPGVHVITAMCHSAGFTGVPWDGAAGGEFDKLQAHLEYLERKYFRTGLMRPATAEEAAARFLDQASDRVCAWPKTAVREGGGWRVDLTVAGAPDLAEPQVVEVLPPLHTVRPGGVGEVRLRSGEQSVRCHAEGTPPWGIAFTVTPANRPGPWSVWYA
ncbi:MAG: hypothetical protein ACM3RP_05645 [Chitinophagales bacterium]